MYILVYKLNHRHVCIQVYVMILCYVRPIWTNKYVLCRTRRISICLLCFHNLVVFLYSVMRRNFYCGNFLRQNTVRTKFELQVKISGFIIFSHSSSFLTVKMFFFLNFIYKGAQEFLSYKVFIQILYIVKYDLMSYVPTGRPLIYFSCSLVNLSRFNATDKR